ncbi:hypothetical protein KUTeg_011570 [Tegillarca granosa]|uniref:RING-type domain-containing protein n=1 Tax=Tegillarca granosa TaxID=220873 RepID=A0ABQ9F291_TEGGR|nr:hypothetical protein KUTeg_011570 [Tegillarca granosa]
MNYKAIKGGVGDKVRCFFCGGGLVNWDPEDEPWTEHARWYPRCVFLRQTKGDDFIFKVQTGITEPDDKSKVTEITDPLSNPAFMSLIDMGCKPDTVKRAWDVLSEVNGRLCSNTTCNARNINPYLSLARQENITAEKLLLEVWKLEEEFKGNHSSNKEKTAAHTSNNRQETETEKEIILKDSLKDLSSKQLNREERLCIEQENRRLKEQQTCKICLDEDVSIVFLPCGHMASCASCAPALRKCPICRTFIKGTVRAILS